MDYGERYTLKAQADMERKMRRIYRQAQEELVEKLKEHNAEMNAQAKVWQAQLESGKITPAKFNRLMNEEIFKSKQWKAKIQSATSTLLNANRQANAIVEGQKRAVYGENALYQAYKFEQGYAGFSFDIYDSATVTKMLRDEPELLPRKVVNGRKDEAWNRHNIADAVTQGIIQGESIDKIADRIAKSTASTNEKAMMRYARTAMTAAQNAGRIEAMHEAQEMGIKVQKRWLATLDNRTRDSHARLDGETVDVDDKFSNGLEFPGDPSANDPGEVFNCRCTLEYVYPEYEGLSEKDERRAYTEWKDKDGNMHRRSKVVNGMTYAEWKGAKVTKQEPKKEEKEEKEYKQNTKQVIEKLKANGIEQLEVKKYAEQPTRDAIITHIAGGDETNGSCASLALAYAGNCAGYDVLDYRDGESRRFFALKSNLRNVMNMESVKTKTIKGMDDIKAATELLKGMEDKKEYILVTGGHAAIVRHTEKGYEWLELQSSTSNGWKAFGSDTLRDRFGCKKSHTFMGEKYEVDNMLVEVDSFAKNEGFAEVLSYINTEASKQHKGVRGNAK